MLYFFLKSGVNVKHYRCTNLCGVERFVLRADASRIHLYNHMSLAYSQQGTLLWVPVLKIFLGQIGNKICLYCYKI